MSGTAPQRILVVVASRHGTTRRIAEALAEDLRAGGLVADVADAASAPAPEGRDAVVIGSAAYSGRWLSPARRYAARHAAALVALPVWLFSSGPPGDSSADAPAGVEAVRLMTGARDHRLARDREALARWAAEVRERLAA